MRCPSRSRPPSVWRSGWQAGAAPDRFLVGLAVLNLLAEVAEEQPLLCIVDDAQWLDEASAQVLAFVARRVAAERLALVFCCATPPTTVTSARSPGLPELRLERARRSDARTLLAAAVPTPLDDEVRDRIVAEARGNPLALLELPRSAPPTRLAGGFELPDALSVPRRIEESFRRRSRDLPAETQLLLLLAAADPTGDAAAAVARGRHTGDRPRGGHARGSGRAAGDRQPGAVPSPAGAFGGLPGLLGAGPPRVHGALAAATDPSPTRTGAPGTARGRCWAPTRRPPPSWSARPDGRVPAADWPPRPRSCSRRPS